MNKREYEAAVKRFSKEPDTKKLEVLFWERLRVCLGDNGVSEMERQGYDQADIDDAKEAQRAADVDQEALQAVLKARGVDLWKSFNDVVQPKKENEDASR